MKPIKPRRQWRDKFREAFSGLRRGVRGQSSYAVHFFFAALVVAAAVALGCSAVEWCLLIGCIGAVLTTEMLNSSIETLFKGLDESGKNRIEGCLDMSAAAVLLASLTSVVVGVIILGGRFGSLLGVW